VLQSSINNGGNCGSPTSILKDELAHAHQVEGRHFARYHCGDIGVVTAICVSPQELGREKLYSLPPSIGHPHQECAS